MKCECEITKKHTGEICYNCEQKNKAKKLNVLDRVKLKRYKILIDSNFSPIEHIECKQLFNYFLIKDIDTSLAPYVK